MLENIEVDGFKSLTQFKLRIRPGLNILVGPNGAGKTNIISFLEFLSFLASSNLNEAILKAGGTGVVFRRSSSQSTTEKRISFRVTGTRSPGHPLIPRDMHYSYSASIILDVASGQLLFKNQELCVAIAGPRGKFKKYKKNNEHVWDLKIISTSTIGHSNELTVERIDQRKIKNQFYFSRSEKVDKKEYMDFVVRTLNHGRLAYTSLVSVAADIFPVAREVEYDFSFGDAFNIIPSVVKRAEDVAMAPGINPDGSGLAATLMYLTRKGSEKFVQSRPSIRYRKQQITQNRIRSTATLVEIERLTKVANGSVSGLRIDRDSFDGRIRVHCRIAATTGDVEIPIQNVSDGTAKWMALVAALVANTKLFAIEEPENFLHPSMQREIVDILRDSLDRAHMKSFALMSTHSETLLNASRPEELIVVQMIDGKTVAAAVEDAEHVRKMIDETGFGLGWYYVSDAFLS